MNSHRLAWSELCRMPTACGRTAVRNSSEHRMRSTMSSLVSPCWPERHGVLQSQARDRGRVAAGRCRPCGPPRAEAAGRRTGRRAGSPPGGPCGRDAPTGGRQPGHQTGRGPPASPASCPPESCPLTPSPIVPGNRVPRSANLPSGPRERTDGASTERPRRRGVGGARSCGGWAVSAMLPRFRHITSTCAARSIRRATTSDHPAQISHRLRTANSSEPPQEDTMGMLDGKVAIVTGAGPGYRTRGGPPAGFRGRQGHRQRRRRLAAGRGRRQAPGRRGRRAHQGGRERRAPSTPPTSARGRGPRPWSTRPSTPSASWTSW